MTTLTIYPDASPKNPDVVTSDPAEIGRLLNAVGVRFERWKADAELAPDASPEEVLAAYKTEVARLSVEAGYETIDKVYQVVCTRDDLLSVPAGTQHWFDMGPEPYFTAIRLFISPDGWVAKFTGDKISSAIPRFNEEPVRALG